MRKPFLSNVAKLTPFEEELNALPHAVKAYLLPFLPAVPDQDEVHDLIMCCLESMSELGHFSKSNASRLIKEMKQKKMRDRYTLYNPRRNISLNQCIGDSKTPVSEWLNITDGQDRE